MSSIEKLKIVGIRSFNPHTENVIEFHTPLTIIVGHNGAGKTTIIECLKYATTGEMPPNSKGGAFVHDPKISRETDVKAQIKLKFRNTRQQAMVVTRSMQLTQTKAKTTLKTLESLLSTVDPKTGEQVSISSRCAQLDSEMPFHLGVSKAVLQNVIFCHQEESLWPLSESSVLKKRFDEIFAAERYTKALDTLRSLRKQLVQDQKVEEEKLSAFKEKRELALRMEADIRSAEERIGSTNERIGGLDAEIEASNVAIAGLQRDLDRLNALQGEYERLLQETKLAEQSYSDLVMTVASVMDETDDELAAMLAQHDERTRGAEANLQRLSQLKSGVAEELAGFEKENGVLLSERGKLWAEHAQRERRSFDLDIALDDLCRSLNIPNQDRAQAIIQSADAFRSMQVEFNREQEENRGKDTLCIEEIQKLVSQSNSLTEARAAKSKTRQELTVKLASITEQLGELEGAMGQMSNLEHNLKRQEEAYRKACIASDTSGHEAAFVELTGQKKALEEEQMQLNADLAALSRSADQRARLDLRRNEAATKSQAAQKLYGDIQSDLQEFLGKVPGLSDVDKEAERILRTRERELKALRERLESARGNQSASQSRVDHLSQSLGKCERDLQEKRRRADGLLGGSDWDFSGSLETAEEELAAVLNALTLSQSSKATYEDFLKSLQSTHACPLCERRFDSTSAESLLHAKLNKFLHSLPTTVLDQEQNRRGLERKVQDLRSLRPIVDDLERLRLLEVPELGRGLKQAKEDLERATLQVEDLSAELSTLQLAMNRLAQLKKKCEDLARLYRDSLQSQAELASLETELATLSSFTTRSAHDLEARSAAIQTQLSLIQQEYDQWQQEAKVHHSRLAEAESEYRDAKEELMKLQLRDSECRALDQQYVELGNSLRIVEAELVGIEENLEPMSGKIAQMKADREAARALAAGKESSLRTRLDSTSTLMARVTNLQSELDGSFHDESLLERVELQITVLEGKITEARQKIANMEQEIALMGREEGEVMLRGRTIKDNIALRSLDARVKELKGRLGQMTGTGANLLMDRTSVMDSLAKRQTRHSMLLGDRSGLQGELRQLEDQAFRHRQDLARSFPDYDLTYHSQLVRVTACAAAIDDLERYAKALDQAIMRYHGHKMDELNRLIRELWMATYQGADIDTIEIRAASEAGGSSGSGSVRTYNYRVVMVKGDSELDMRGRSSAGQRVLASLIIRLALAETFGQSCGILALDEPTTNLDKDNIEALASALADIIRARRQQANFQLVIITHDEEFVEMLGRYECADYYYRVFKDDSQYSTIEQQAFQGALN